VKLFAESLSAIDQATVPDTFVLRTFVLPCAASTIGSVIQWRDKYDVRFVPSNVPFVPSAQAMRPDPCLLKTTD
jgi:hypothetical protein